METAELKKLFKDQGEAFDQLKKDIPDLASKKVDAMLLEREANITKALEDFEKQIEGATTKQEAMEQEMAILKTMPGSREQEELELEHDYNQVLNKYIRQETLKAADLEILAKCNDAWLKKDQIVANPSEGGLTVMPTFSNRISQKRFESSPMRQLATVISIGTEEWIDWYDDSEVAVEKVAETEARSETVGVFLHEVKIPIHDKAAEIPVSRKLLRSSQINWPAYLEGKVGRKMSRDDNKDSISHDGSKGMKGILTYAVSPTNEPGKFDTLEEVDINAADYVGMVDLQDSLLDEFQQNASWLMRRQTRSLLRKLVDSQQRPLWEPSLQAGHPPLFFGAPVLAAADMEEGVSGKKSIAYGDFREGYTMVDRVGLEIVINEVTDVRYKIFKFIHATGGGVVQFQAIKIGKQS